MEQELHTRGFVVVGSVAPPTNETLEDVTDTRSIFNCSDKTLKARQVRLRTTRRKRKRRRLNYAGDEARQQGEVTSDTRDWRHFIRAVHTLLREALPNHGIGKQLTVSSFVLIQSAARCQRQAAHTDYVPTSAMAEVIASTPTRMPLGMIVAVDTDTTLEVWPGSIGLITRTLGGGGAAVEELPKIKRLTQPLKQGEVLVFRGDLVHAGSAYARPHRRLHAYWDSDLVPREVDTTYLIQQADRDLGAALCMAP